MAVAGAALDERRAVDTDILHTVAAYHWARSPARDDSALPAADRLTDTGSSVELLARVAALPEESSARRARHRPRQEPASETATETQDGRAARSRRRRRIR
ncbi:hypothetical protein AB0G85_06900 [Streptomyces sioyaensis]|uniref:hypothetical protein n=1 Tax=Streptomyces sioyaensis TaxID=67364 RepID=UPI003411C77C